MESDRERWGSSSLSDQEIADFRPEKAVVGNWWPNLRIGMAMVDCSIPDALRNPFREALRNRSRLIGLWSVSASHIVAEVLSYAGFDWILFDEEHSTNDLSTLVCQLQAMKGSATASVVRPAWNDPVLIKHLLDIGFRNFLIPMVQSEEEACAAIAATRYPPYGFRGVSVMARANAFGNLQGYHLGANECIGVIIQVETRKSLDALEAICDVESLDGIFVGPNDLAASLGHIVETGHPEVQEAIRYVAEVAASKGKTAGILVPDEEEARRYLEWGYTLVAVGADLGLLRSSAAALAKKFEEH